MKKAHRIWTFLIGPLAFGLFVVGAAAAQVPLVAESYHVPAADPGIEQDPPGREPGMCVPSPTTT
jgi:hypothetical protein